MTALERQASLHLDGWAGRSSQAVIVVGETRARYRIRSDHGMRLPGRWRWLAPGGTALVPKTAITFAESEAEADVNPNPRLARPVRLDGEGVARTPGHDSLTEAATPGGDAWAT